MGEIQSSGLGCPYIKTETIGISYLGKQCIRLESQESDFEFPGACFLLGQKWKANFVVWGKGKVISDVDLTKLNC